jgi:hypothetical protein
VDHLEHRLAMSIEEHLLHSFYCTLFIALFLLNSIY